MSVHSMTAYGFGEATNGNWQISCDVRTLNSRFIEANFRMPRNLIGLEPELLAKVKSTLARGKVDVFFDISRSNDVADLPELDPVALTHFLKTFAEANKTIKEFDPELSTRSPSASELMRMEGVLKTRSGSSNTQEELDEKKVPIFEALSMALDALKIARVKEGESLKVALLSLIGEITESRKIIESRVSDIRGWIHDTYIKRLTKVMEDLEKTGHDTHRPPEERITAEISLLTDKADIEEEITRLKTHEAEFASIINGGGPIGRKLDFLCQELHREVNTISSKLQPTEISEHTLNMKQAVERIRQQVQNIE